jgi:DNA mismatch repair protein MSH5
VGQWEELSDEQRQICVSSLLPLESVNMVRALGVLLKFIDKRRLGVELEEQGVRVPILALRHFSL